jgi:YesN/AraC family two-component response regulator
MLKPTNLPQLREILMQIEENLPGMETHPTAERAGVQNFIVSKAMDYIEANYMNKIELDDIAAQVYVTRNYLSSLFKKHTGVTVVEYITEVRLSKAKEYLKIPGYSMSEIAKKIGMKSARYFSSSFKEKYGLTPTEYRHKME